MTVFGDLSFVVSANLGALGPRDGKPINYHWNWYWNLARLLPWLLLLPFLLKARNRNLRAASILIPVLILMGCVTAVAWAMERVGGSSDAMAEVASIVAIGLAATWLSAGAAYARARLALAKPSVVLLFSTGVASLWVGVDSASLSASCLAASLFGFALPSIVAGAAALYFTRRSRSLSRFIVGFYCGFAVVTLCCAMAVAVMLGFVAGPFAALGAVFGVLGCGFLCCIPLTLFILFTCCSKEYSERWRTELIPPVPAPSAAPAVEGQPAQEPWPLPESIEPLSAAGQEPGPKEE